MSFYTDVLVHCPQFHSVERVRSVLYLEPVTRAAVIAIMSDAEALGTPLMLFETFRSRERQLALFRQGATRLQTVGCHHYGVAADLVRNINGEPSWKGDFRFLGALAKKHGLVWGGDWGDASVKHSFIDADHVQRVAVQDQVGLFSGAWYPADDYVAGGG